MSQSILVLHIEALPVVFQNQGLHVSENTYMEKFLPFWKHQDLMNLYFETKREHNFCTQKSRTRIKNFAMLNAYN